MVNYPHPPTHPHTHPPTHPYNKKNWISKMRITSLKSKTQISFTRTEQYSKRESIGPHGSASTSLRGIKYVKVRVQYQPKNEKNAQKYGKDVKTTKLYQPKNLKRCKIC